MNMAGLATRDPAVDRSLRSVFVGNIPYEATEEQLKDIFSEVGPVVSFRLVYDRETGKPKGYGFCEYQDQETALSAMRNLNGREFSGRALRVDNAASEKNKEELKSLGTGAPIIESPYGDPINPEEAPESISRAVASLPPEQMFELMKQMKLCVQNSPQEARNMLLQNPQLAYALLQAQVVMRIVDPEIAVKILHRPTSVQPLNQQQPAGPGQNPQISQQKPSGPQPQQMGGMHVNGAPPMMQPTQMQGGGPGPMPSSLPGPLPGGGMQPQMGIPAGGPMPMDRGQGGLQPQMGIPAGGPMPMDRGQVSMQDPRGPMQRGPPVSNIPPRGLLGDGPNDPRAGGLINVPGDEPSRGYMGPPHPGQPMHHVPSQDNRGPPLHEMRGGPMGEPRPMMGEPRPMMGEPRPMMGEPRPMMGEPRQMMGEPRGGPMMDRGVPPMDNRGGRDPRAMEPRGMDSRVPVPAPRGQMPVGMQGPGPLNMGGGAPQGPRPVPGMQGGGQGGFSPGQNQVTPQDHEKAALIMQVLQLTPDQIAMLPPEQRQSILILKEQIQKSTGAP